MKVLLPSVLTLEAVVVALAIPVALALGDGGARAGWTLALLSVLLLVGAGVVRRPRALVVGWILQGLVLLSGLVVPAMAVLGLVFLGVWVLAVIYGAKGDAAAARNAAAGVSRPDGGAPTAG